MTLFLYNSWIISLIWLYNSTLSLYLSISSSTAKVYILARCKCFGNNSWDLVRIILATICCNLVILLIDERIIIFVVWCKLTPEAATDDNINTDIKSPSIFLGELYILTISLRSFSGVSPEIIE